MVMPLLTTKLYVPPPRPDLVPRPRLVERLDKRFGGWVVISFWPTSDRCKEMYLALRRPSRWQSGSR
jgi:hypothetical protein